ncbi:MAG TPA: hypothetical protein VOA41_13415 [Candidatus Dormibacteraeota bacterium]|nr:hypothetical protein [Candidatus Dormibacteraeota bacterium]
MMRSNKILRFLALAAFAVAVASAPRQSTLAAQNETGSIEFVARVTPTDARPEPVRKFTFYLLKKSYAEIRAEAEQAQPKPDQESFISKLGVSDQLKVWMKQNNTMELTSPEIIKLLTADTILAIPEFKDAYFRANNGMARGLPRPRFKEIDRTQNPEKYTKQKAEYQVALHKFIESNPLTVEGTETELATVTPHLVWARLQNSYRQQMERRVPELAQTKYFVAMADTDLEGRGMMNRIPAGNYWLSTLGLEAAAGDARLNWDVQVAVQPGQASRVELTNLNASLWRGSALR